MSKLDYSKFEKLGKESTYKTKQNKIVDKEDKREKEEEREQARVRYMKEQREKQVKWEEDMRKQGKDPEKIKANMSSCGCASSTFLNGQLNEQPHDHAHDKDHGHDHNHDHNHDHSHDHNHDHNHDHDHDDDHDQSHEHSNGNTQDKSHGPPEPKALPNKPSCGYMPVEEIKRLQFCNLNLVQKRTRIETPDVDRRKEQKKEEAALATREDGNRIFKEGNYELAFKVYERGVLIINGMQNMTDAKCEEMEKLESLLDLNMALCKLKLKQYTECIDLCRMSLQLDDANPKAYYRWAEALVEMGEFEEARTQCIEAAKRAPESDKACPKMLEKIDKLQAMQLQKQKENEKKIAAKFSKQFAE
ncbi:periplasmic solute binding protein [Reticulomyxa filosa]|uniref:peptidylprolyl isomerase n=1 Tax=Reticulomyxa filosa TaxID=46433 RepID=X6M271_RETFI|nr:periplasmic solute binding protein [Reticulomyxa filosa]|eukprot:ETO07964.1 periplasmic solute binding protein [Reticulomyxa filosa]